MSEGVRVMGNFLAGVDCRQCLQRQTLVGFVSCDQIKRTNEEQAKNVDLLSGGHEKKKKPDIFREGVK